MKKILSVFIVSGTLFFLYSQSVTEPQKKFIKGNLTDKSAAVRESSGSDHGELALTALDFANTNRVILGKDRDLSILAVTSILSLPKEKFSDETKNQYTTTQLYKTFCTFEDENVRISVLDKLPVFINAKENPQIINDINAFLKNAADHKAGSVKASILCLGKTGNKESYSILYNGWKNNLWESFKTETENSLLQLGENNIADVIAKISTSNIEDNYKFLCLTEQNQKISKNFKSEVAENALSQAIHNREVNSQMSKCEVDYQLLALRIISENNWTRASVLAVKYFAIAKQEYENSQLTENQFITVINETARVGSSQSVSVLSNYLAQLNKIVEQNKLPEKNVVLAVISNLGALGDKASFDNLLYVTYLSYPEDVIQASRDALSKLKW